MQMFGRASLVLAAIWAFAQGRPLGDDYPQVTGVRIMEESLLKHKTNMYRLKGGFVVRRGYAAIAPLCNLINGRVIVTSDVPSQRAIHLRSGDVLASGR
jgi:uncharacterized cupin superfamily protein